MIKIDEIIIVEGKYDKIKLDPLVDATIVVTNGFRIFNDKEKIAMLRTLAKKRGLLILTDSDRAGFFIRGRLNSYIKEGVIKHAYIPDILGKEKRKTEASKEGKLGVEGMEPKILIAALKKAGIGTSEVENRREREITKAHLFEDGLAGGDGAHEARIKLAKKLGLPERISSNGLLDVLNALYTLEEYRKLIRE